MRIHPICPILVFVFAISCSTDADTESENTVTFCNPLDLSYRFQPEEPSRREAADPTVILYRDTYILFASKSGGYWHSDDLADWEFTETTEIPIEEYAPTAVVIGDTVYFLASSTQKSAVYKSGDPLSGHWDIAVESLEVPVWDPAFYLDDDGKLFLYWGCSNANPIHGVEVDYGNGFRFMGETKDLLYGHPETHGWEVPGDYNTRTGVAPWIEGAWMNKREGRYYLQYAGPGTEFKSYCDGVYVSNHPLGPFQSSIHNPFAYKPEGFAAGAGHGSTFQDRYGNWWHVGTMTISRKHMFERRLGLFPLFFDEDGVMHSETGFGDYPMIVPEKKIERAEELFPGWMLLSFQKEATVSSAVDSLPASNMTDEDIRTYWAAETGDEGEWVILDLGKSYDVYSLQINFAEHQTEILGGRGERAYQFVIDCSQDGSSWKLVADRSDNSGDNSHEYIQLTGKVNCRYLRLRSIQVPDGQLAISGFRVFGKGDGDLPDGVAELVAVRDPEDRRSVLLQWSRSAYATGYMIRYGVEKDMLYQSYMVYSDTVVAIHSLNTGSPYYFLADAFNENGITPGGGNGIPVE